MLWGGPCDSEGLPIATLCTGWPGLSAMPMAPGGSHRLAFNPFCLGEFLSPSEIGAMMTRGWEGGGPHGPRGTPLGGYMMLHWVAPQQSLMSASPVFATVGLLGGGSAFFSAREPAARQSTEREREMGGKENFNMGGPDHPDPWPDLFWVCILRGLVTISTSCSPLAFGFQLPTRAFSPSPSQQS